MKKQKGEKGEQGKAVRPEGSGQERCRTGALRTLSQRRQQKPAVSPPCGLVSQLGGVGAVDGLLGVHSVTSGGNASQALCPCPWGMVLPGEGWWDTSF